MDIDLGEKLAERAESHIRDTGIEEYAKSVEENQWALACSVVHTEEERQAIIEGSKQVQYIFSREGTQFRLSREELNEPIIFNLITEGKSGIYTKGKGNPVEQLDGTTEPSNSVTKGVHLPWLEWNAVPVEDDANRILSDTAPSFFEDGINAAIPEFSEQDIKPWIGNEIQARIGADS